jgi:hypothetical protein
MAARNKERIHSQLIKIIREASFQDALPDVVEEIWSTCQVELRLRQRPGQPRIEVQIWFESRISHGIQGKALLTT